MSSLILTLLIISIIAVVFLIVALFYVIASFRRRSITMKKVDYLVEDITYKSEMLTSTVETVSKISNYIDAFEVVTRKNIKSATKLYFRNKDDIEKVLQRILRLATGESKETASKTNSKKTNKKNTIKKN